MFVVSVEFLADDPALVKATGGTEAMRTVHVTTMGASGAFSQKGFPVGAAMTLFRVANTFLGYGHGDNTSKLNRIELRSQDNVYM